MSLRKKTLLVIGATLVGLVGVLYATSSTILLGSLTQAEERQTRQVVRGVVNVFAQNQEEFSDSFVDWSAWDGTYTFIEDADPQYIQSNLIPEALVNLKLNLVLFVHRSGRIVFGTRFDLKTQQQTPIPQELIEQFANSDRLWQHNDLTSRTTGILLLPSGPMVITSQPIVTTKGIGPIRGTVIFGRYLDADAIKKLAQINRVSLEIYPVNEAELPPDFQAARLHFLGEDWPKKIATTHDPVRAKHCGWNIGVKAKVFLPQCFAPTHDPLLDTIVVRPLSEQAIAGYTILKDIYDKPALLLRVEVPREIYKQGQSSQRYLIISVLVVGLIFGGVTLLFVERLVLFRLAHLSRGVSRIGKSGNLSTRLLVAGEDELSYLADDINKMLAALEESGRKRQESEALHLAVVEQVSEGIFLFDVQTRRIIETNTAFQQLLGYSAAETLELTVYDFVACDREIIDRQIQLAFQDKRCYRIERRYRRRDGSLIDVEASVSPIVCDGREVVCVVVYDITERKKVEEALRQAEAKYREIFENATEGIFQSTPDGRYISANPTLAKLYGYSSAEELMANLTDIGQQLYVDRNRYARFLSTMEKHDAVTRFVSQIYRQDRSIIWISENVRAVRDSEGNLLYYEGTVEDITERKVVAEALRYQQEQSENLLLNILPGPIAARLKLEESTIADSFAEVTVLFADIVGFTEISAEIPPTELVSLLNEIFSAFDQLAEQHGLEKIKTIGDAYMVAGGLPMHRTDHAEAIAEMALGMQAAITQFQTKHGKAFSIRIGINTGPVVAGVIGIKRLIYDLWGDTVNIASRMESHGLPGCIQVTDTTYKRLRDRYLFEKRGTIEVKGKGEMTTYLLIGKICPVIVPTSQVMDFA